jgi:hypothetical protein
LKCAAIFVAKIAGLYGGKSGSISGTFHRTSDSPWVATVLTFFSALLMSGMTQRSSDVSIEDRSVDTSAAVRNDGSAAMKNSEIRHRKKEISAVGKRNKQRMGAAMQTFNKSKFQNVQYFVTSKGAFETNASGELMRSFAVEKKSNELKVTNSGSLQLDAHQTPDATVTRLKPMLYLKFGRQFYFALKVSGNSALAKSLEKAFPGGGTLIICAFFIQSNQKEAADLTSFYNNAQQSHEGQSAKAKMSPGDQKFLQKLGHSFLCYSIEYLVANGLLAPDAIISLDAEGTMAGYQTDIPALVAMYKKIGFKDNEVPVSGEEENLEYRSMSGSVADLRRHCTMQARHFFGDTIEVQDDRMEEEKVETKTEAKALKRKRKQRKTRRKRKLRS